MKRSLLLACLSSLTLASADTLPPVLQDWVGWALKDDPPAGTPVRFDQPELPMKLWTEALEITVGATGGNFKVTATGFAGGWLPLPGSAEAWPQSVVVSGGGVHVLNKEGMPVVQLNSGPSSQTVEGSFIWDEMPQKILLPRLYGVLRLKLNGQDVEQPVWDAEGHLWLQRTSTQATDKDFLALEVHRLIEDGSPMWLHTQVELTVAGKSREEVLGHALPDGWKLSSVSAPIPAAVDEQGQLKAQVRPGKWTLVLDAFRTTPAASIAYATGAKALVGEELIGLQARPGFRAIEVRGLTAIDVAQTKFPDSWRQYPVYQWPTSQAFQIAENMRGMGLKKAPGISITRRFWLDEDGAAFTYEDAVTGSGQETWRLDAAEKHALGAAKIQGKGQLITRNPANDAIGVEVRDRSLSLQAVGRLPRETSLSATGWRTDVESLRSHVNLPPGWRMIGVFGADWSRGDWMTQWSLYDVFLLLLAALLLWRVWGVVPCVIGVLAFVLTYHELGAPRYTWALLFAALSASKMLKLSGRAGDLVNKGPWVAVALLAFQAVPFVIQQVQQALYPQLEPYRYTWQDDRDFEMASGGSLQMIPASPAPALEAARDVLSGIVSSRNTSAGYTEKLSKGNLQFDKKARIQTGPAIPNWRWREVSFGWSGPVTKSEQVKLWLLPAWANRAVSLGRVVLIVGLIGLLLRGKRTRPAGSALTPSPGAAMLIGWLALGTLTAQAQQVIPSDELLKQLRDHVLHPDRDAPARAEIPHASIAITGRRFEMEVEVHHLGVVGVPLPGKLPAWTPLKVQEGDAPVPSVRHDDYLWVMTSPNSGVQHFKVTGALPPAAEWQCSFLLKPRRLTIEAPEWSVTGLKPNGVPEDTVVFTEKKRTTTAEAAYDQKDFNPIVSVQRELELGLVWQVRTRVTRLSAVGKALTLSLPLLPGERVLSNTEPADEGRITVRLGANDREFQWESELAQATTLDLFAEATDSWAEQWTLTSSPIWNVSTSGLAPVYEASASTLQPQWTPWPGEKVSLALSRPEAVQGDIVTVQRAEHSVSLGDRQQKSRLTLHLNASLGEDFALTLPKEAEVTKLMLAGTELPVRRAGTQLIVPLRPGEQQLQLEWKLSQPLSFRSQPAEVKLPVAISNLSTTITVPAARWLLMASGPMRGPAVRFWGMALVALLLGAALARVPNSPMKPLSWGVLLLGFLQLPMIVGAGVVLWFFVMAMRGHFADTLMRQSWFRVNVTQLVLAGATLLVALALLAVVQTGLLGQPEMWVTGFGSTTDTLKWFQDRSPDGTLTRPTVLSVTIWGYRLLMLAWALWLAKSVLRWAPWTMKMLRTSGWWKARPAKVSLQPPPLSNE